MKVAARGTGCGETKLRKSCEMFSWESEVKEKLLSAQIKSSVRHCTSTRKVFSKLPEGREVQPTGDVLWYNQVRSVLIVFISMSYVVLSKLSAFCVKSIKLCWTAFFFLISVFNEALQASLTFCLFSIRTLGRENPEKWLFSLLSSE